MLDGQVRLLAFMIIGGSNAQPISKLITAVYYDGDSFYAPKHRYYVRVYAHNSHNDFLPSNDGEEIWTSGPLDDLGLAEEIFNEIKDVQTAKAWAHDDAEVAGEMRHWERCAL